MLTDCIEYKSIGRNGYGQVKRAGKKEGAHRLAWQTVNGPIPPGMCICHKCDKPACVNPDHLFLGTYGDNIKDCYNKGRRRLASKPKVSEQTAVAIKMLDGVIPHRQIALQLGVAQSYVRNIAIGKRFANVAANTRYTF